MSDDYPNDFDGSPEPGNDSPAEYTHDNPPPKELVDFVNQQAARELEEEGLRWEDATPDELTLLKRNAPTPAEYLKTVRNVKQVIKDRKVSEAITRHNAPKGTEAALIARLQELRQDPFTPEARSERAQIERQLSKMVKRKSY